MAFCTTDCTQCPLYREKMCVHFTLHKSITYETRILGIKRNAYSDIFPFSFFPFVVKAIISIKLLLLIGL